MENADREATEAGQAHLKMNPPPRGNKTMRNLIFTVATTAMLAASGTLMTGVADAAVSGPSNGMRAALDGFNMVDTVQYVYGGRRHCWYPNGWHGPGWYWCGYHMRRGLGWGGGEGWQGWRREYRREHRREERRERRY